MTISNAIQLPHHNSIVHKTGIPVCCSYQDLNLGKFTQEQKMPKFSMLLFLLYFLCSLPFLQAPTAADTPTDGEAGLTTFPAAPLKGSNA